MSSAFYIGKDRHNRQTFKHGQYYQEKKENSVLLDLFSDYCSNATLHGIRYLGDKNKTISEKIWWLIVFITSTCCCAYLISNTWIKWKTYPVILSFAPEQTPIWSIPFPAVTICPFDKLEQSRYNYTKKLGDMKNLSEEEFATFLDISLVCDVEDLTAFLGDRVVVNFTRENIITKLKSILHQLDDTIMSVSWRNKNESITMFADQITEDGLCFTFNSFSQEDMYTSQLHFDVAGRCTSNIQFAINKIDNFTLSIKAAEINLRFYRFTRSIAALVKKNAWDRDHRIVFIDHSEKNVGWNLENGYPSISVSGDYPRRTAEDGYISGLSIFLSSYNGDKDSVCGNPVEGYKIMLHSPAETPKPSHQFILASLNQQILITVKPELITTADTLLKLHPHVRKCYFSNEKSLRFFNVYTQNNCRTECIVNITQQFCGCVPFYMPRDGKSKICSFGKIECMFKAENKILNFEAMNKIPYEELTEAEKVEANIFTECDCLASCSSLSFSAETSQAKIQDNQKYITFLKALPDGLLNKTFLENIDPLTSLFTNTQVDIFFKEKQFLSMHRSELYGQTDFFANIGGLLGLFMGFSVLSLIEIFYFLTIRTWCTIKNRKKIHKLIKIPFVR